MNRVKLSLNYSKLDHSGKVVFGNQILTALTGNTNYVLLAGTLALLLPAVTALDNEIKAPNPSLIAIKSKEVQLEKILYALKALVELECNNDEAIATTSGFSLSNGKTLKAKIFTATQGMLSGTVNLQCPYVKGAAYVWEYINDPINLNAWQQLKITNTTTTQATNLTPGNKYWFRVKTIVKDNEQSYSDPYLVHVV